MPTDNLHPITSTRQTANTRNLQPKVYSNHLHQCHLNRAYIIHCHTNRCWLLLTRKDTRPIHSSLTRICTLAQRHRRQEAIIIHLNLTILVSIPMGRLLWGIRLWDTHHQWLTLQKRKKNKP